MCKKSDSDLMSLDVFNKEIKVQEYDDKDHANVYTLPDVMVEVY